MWKEAIIDLQKDQLTQRAANAFASAQHGWCRPIQNGRFILKLIFGKSKWEMWGDPLEVFLQRVTASGFEATEIYLGSLHESPADVARLNATYGLRLIGQILTQGQSYS